MKIMEQDKFNRLIHDLGYISKYVLIDLQKYDNVRVIPLGVIDNKQTYNILLNEDSDIDNIEAKISYTYIDNESTENMVYLKDIMKLSDVSKIYGISKTALIDRLKHLKEGIDYRKFGLRQSILLTPKGVEKIINIKGVEL